MNIVESERRDGIRTIDFNSPPLNILTINLMRDIRKEIERTDKAPVLLLKGSGKIFSAGVAIEEHTDDLVADMISAITELIITIMEYPGVTVSAVHGGAYGGGCEVALCTDMVFAERDAVFSVPEISLGVFPPAAIAIFPELYPDSWVKELVFSGKEFRADSLKKIGIVNKFLQGDRVEEEARDCLEKYTGFSRPVVRLTKESFNIDLDQIKDRMDRINEIYLDDLMDVRDVKEGLRAFLEDREPEWNHE